MLIVDAQVHLWNVGNPGSPWHRDVAACLNVRLELAALVGKVPNMKSSLTPSAPRD